MEFFKNVWHILTQKYARSTQHTKAAQDCNERGSRGESSRSDKVRVGVLLYLSPYLARRNGQQGIYIYTAKLHKQTNIGVSH